MSKDRPECPKFMVRYVQQRLQQINVASEKDARSWWLRMLVRRDFPASPHAAEVVELSGCLDLDEIRNEHVRGVWFVFPSFVMHPNDTNPGTLEAPPIKEVVPIPVFLFYCRPSGHPCLVIEVATNGTSTTSEFTLPKGALSQEMGPKHSETSTKRLAKGHPWHPVTRLLAEIEKSNRDRKVSM